MALGTGHGKLLPIFFLHQQFLSSISVDFSQKIACGKEKNTLRHNHFISIVCSVIDNSSLPISRPEIA